MSTLGPDAQELLGQKPTEGAAPEPQRDAQGRFVGQQTPAEGAAPKEGTDKPPQGFAPIAALQGEQEVARKAREESARYRAAMELAGFQFDETGNPTPPAPPQSAPTGVSPRVQALADSLGIDPAVLQEAVDERVMQTGGVLLDPVTRAGFEQTVRGFATDDPDFPIYAKTFREEVEQRVRTLPPHLQSVGRNHPPLLADAKASAWLKHRDELIDRAVARKAAGQGKVVGRWVEGANPGTSEEAAPTPFSEESLAWMRRAGYTADEITRAAQRREVSGRNK